MVTLSATSTGKDQADAHWQFALRPGDVSTQVVVSALIRYGIDSISVTPDAVEQTRYNIAAAEQRILLEAQRANGKVASR